LLGLGERHPISRDRDPDRRVTVTRRRDLGTMSGRVWKILGLFLALSIAPQPSVAQAPATACGLSNLAACRTTNALIWDTGFRQALAQFLGERQAAYLWEGGSVLGQARAVLGGPPDAPTLVGDLYRFTACRLHSCTEKGAWFSRRAEKSGRWPSCIRPAPWRRGRPVARRGRGSPFIFIPTPIERSSSVICRIGPRTPSRANTRLRVSRLRGWREWMS
jgi:hypothetical protein